MKQTRKKLIQQLWLVSTLMLLSLTSQASENPAIDAWLKQIGAPGYSSGGKDTCTDCHSSKQIGGIDATPHGQTLDHRTPMAQGQACETCHGPNDAHASASSDDNRPPTTIRFGRDSETPADIQNAVCTDCHSGDTQKHWAVSEHASADVACSSCHSVHDSHDKVRDKQAQVEVCTSCHTEQKANLMKFSRHPVREGIVACTDCHSPHGGKGPAMLEQATVSETCYECHAEKRGPFLFEHEPVQDDCTTCHTPHGSVHDNMLRSRAPFLCQQCHIATRHPGTVYVDGQEISLLGNSRASAKACMNCHSQIHGSNHPSGSTFRR